MRRSMGVRKLENARGGGTLVFWISILFGFDCFDIRVSDFGFSRSGNFPFRRSNVVQFAALGVNDHRRQSSSQ
jgi:hypothetical protein